MNVFINERLKVDSKEWAPVSEEHFNEVVFNLVSILKSFKFHTDVVVHYSSVAMQLLLKNFSEIADMLPSNYRNKIDRIRVLLDEVNARNWHKYKKQRNDIIYFCQEFSGQTTHSVNDTSLAEATEYKFNKENVAVVNLTHSEYNNFIPIHINRSTIVPPNTMEMLRLDTFINKGDLISYITYNWYQRNYNHNPKHGENGKNVIPNKDEDVSPLECSIEEARELLRFAVSTRNKAELYVFDPPRNKFIIYKAESEQVYHGYHPLDQDEVPKEVKDFFLKL